MLQLFNYIDAVRPSINISSIPILMFFPIYRGLRIETDLNWFESYRLFPLTIRYQNRHQIRYQIRYQIQAISGIPTVTVN